MADNAILGGNFQRKSTMLKTWQMSKYLDLANL